ncbi:hypothetical protein BD408DRAFT_433265 [Parasitella parasitica]|nr:hypothetical protein BD408DRAFT_433265 [Parasitella parasitica]
MHRSNRDRPSCLIITVALLKAELFWVCSAVSCLYHSTSKSKPPMRSFSSVSQGTVSMITADRKDKMQLTEKEHHIANRRLSLQLLIQNDDVDYRPSVKDEMNGTTCPPIWWQKAKNKLSSTSSHSRNNSSADSLMNNLSTCATNTDIDYDQPTFAYMQPVDSRPNSTLSALLHPNNASEKNQRHVYARETMNKFKTRILKVFQHRKSTQQNPDKLKL